MAVTVGNVNRILAKNMLPSLRAEREHYASGKAFEFRPGTNAMTVVVLDAQIAMCERILAEPEPEPVTTRLFIAGHESHDAGRAFLPIWKSAGNDNEHPWNPGVDVLFLPACNLPAAASDLHHGIIPRRVFAGA